MSNHPPKAEEFVRDERGLISTTVEPERAILAHLTITSHPDHRAPSQANNQNPELEEDEIEEKTSLDELAGLTDAAGAQVVGTITQKRPKPEAATLFGKGKVEEIKALCADTNAEVLIVDCELTPAQSKNLEKELELRVIDRTELILDIFARRAQTHQAKLQIELAQLRYQLPRLKKMWGHLGRTGAGVGARGPGETQLETDRSMARERVNFLQRQLDTIRKQRKTESGARFEFDLGALVGYTNVGKSALLNAMSNPTGKRVYEANQLFATLGAATRKVELGGGRSILLSDTVGFVRRLPHFLVESFHSTLNEVENADFLLLVVDGADPELDEKLHSVQKVLGELKVLETPHILVLNQCDRLDSEQRDDLSRRYPDGVFTSAVSGEGLDDLHARVKKLLDAQAHEVHFVLPATDPETGRVLSDIARHGEIVEQNWTQNGDDQPVLHVCARLAPRWSELLEAYQSENPFRDASRDASDTPLQTVTV